MCCRGRLFRNIRAMVGSCYSVQLRLSILNMVGQGGDLRSFWPVRSPRTIMQVVTDAPFLYDSLTSVAGIVVSAPFVPAFTCCAYRYLQVQSVDVVSEEKKTIATEKKCMNIRDEKTRRIEGTNSGNTERSQKQCE